MIGPNILDQAVDVIQIQLPKDSSITVLYLWNCDEHNFGRLHLFRMPTHRYAAGMETVRLLQRSRFVVNAAAGLECMLRANRPLRLAGARGRRIHCTAGCAWITAPGMLADVFLRDGEAWQIDTDELVLVEAIGSAMVTITAPDSCVMSDG